MARTAIICTLHMSKKLKQYGTEGNDYHLDTILISKFITLTSRLGNVSINKVVWTSQLPLPYSTTDYKPKRNRVSSMSNIYVVGMAVLVTINGNADGDLIYEDNLFNPVTFIHRDRTR
ncbi:hypothetical protein EWB00_006802 [Schistosoma japonicum]|uniref:Uncharacterized protein n=1 Tax=Schistosoma japonicum TaxID=6182 RepID=A0A4Z2CXX1_SCHJA|nr:hypothetical protein EWB00_006802 [Schistosoma japonicum]